jgi:hypothetical protein
MAHHKNSRPAGVLAERKQKGINVDGCEIMGCAKEQMENENESV